jgi:hypothetical protein
MNRLKSPLTAHEIVDLYFLENRARLLEIAAFLDRVERADGAGQAREDYRYRALHKGVELLLQPAEERAKALQLVFSDPTPEPIASAAGLKGASGAWKGGQS